ncbi:MAG: hypothetical protein NC324_10545, partial [Bacteroides sp.]|nr:hypothetical protein [Bacteroides sp.]
MKKLLLLGLTTLTMLFSSVGFVRAEGEGTDPETPVDTETTLPADVEGAPALTLTPADTDSVDNNTEILISGAEGYSVEWNTYATVEAAEEGRYGSVYGA